MAEPIEHLGIELANDFDDKVPRIRDVDLGAQLGMVQPRDIRGTIRAHAQILSAFGVCARRPQTSGSLGGRPATEYWLNKEQALYVASKSETEAGRQTLVMLVKAFSAFEQMILDRIPPLLRAEFAPWSKTWQDDLMKELCTLKGEVFNGRHPRWCAHINSVIYECLLGKDVYAQLKAQNPKPSRGHNHHQLITPEYRDAFNRQLGFVAGLASSCASLADLEGHLRRIYQKAPRQLPLWPPPRKLQGLAKALPTPHPDKLEKPA